MPWFAFAVAIAVAHAVAVVVAVVVVVAIAVAVAVIFLVSVAIAIAVAVAVAVTVAITIVDAVVVSIIDISEVHHSTHMSLTLAKLCGEWQLVSGNYKARGASGGKYEARIAIFHILAAVNRFSWISWKAENR